MKKRIILILILSLFINVSFVNAKCTNEKKEQFIEQAKNIMIKYKDIGGTPLVDPNDPNDGCNLYDDCGKYDNGTYKITIEDMTEEFNIMIKDTDFTSNSDEILLEYGDYSFDVYSNECEEVIHTIKVHLPKYNYLSETTYCDGINKYKFYLCDPYDETDIDYDEFVKEVMKYREENKIGKDTNKINMYFNKTIDFIRANIKYEVIALGTVICIILMFFLIRKIKKRGVLE